jgi:hypothetical protein
MWAADVNGDSGAESNDWMDGAMDSRSVSVVTASNLPSDAVGVFGVWGLLCDTDGADALGAPLAMVVDVVPE